MSESVRVGATGALRPIRADAEVVANRDEGGGNRRIVLRVPDWPGAEAGQFVMLSAGVRSEVERTDPLLPRPMAVFRSDGSDVEIFYKIVGRGTGLIAEAGVGQRLRLVGPLGEGFPQPPADALAVLVGGGTGIASLWELAARSAARGPVRVLLGGRSAADLMGRADFEALDVDLRVATEDGSDGHQGLVTDLLAESLDEPGESWVCACGPTPMMQRCAELAAERNAACHVSLENGMACGFGVCLGCAVPRSEGGYALVCRDGPVFDAGGIAWEGLP